MKRAPRIGYVLHQAFLLVRSSPWLTAVSALTIALALTLVLPLKLTLPLIRYRPGLKATVVGPALNDSPP